MVDLVVMVDETEFEKDVLEYKDAELESAKLFINNLIKLGSILEAKKQKYIKDDEWYKYLKHIGKAPSAAGQLVRLFDYSKKNLKALLDSNITNWAKLNYFLTLPDDAKVELSEELQGADLDSKNFIDKAKNIKKKHTEVETETLDESDVDNEDMEIGNQTEVENTELTAANLNLEEIINNSKFVDTHFMAKHVLRECNESGEIEFSDHCMPFVETVLEMEKLIQEGSKTTLLKKLSQAEKEYWKVQLKSQIAKLNTMLDTI